jgi:hypothetical protein
VPLGLRHSAYSAEAAPKSATKYLQVINGWRSFGA